MELSFIEDSLRVSVDENHRWRVVGTVALDPLDQARAVVLRLTMLDAKGQTIFETELEVPINRCPKGVVVGFVQPGPPSFHGGIAALLVEARVQVNDRELRASSRLDRRQILLAESMSAEERQITEALGGPGYERDL